MCLLNLGNMGPLEQQERWKIMLLTNTTAVNYTNVLLLLGQRHAKAMF